MVSTEPIFEFYPSQEFRNHSSLLLEIGPGRGDFLFHLSQENPNQPIVAIEYKRKRFEKLIERTRKKERGNISLILGDAREALPLFFHEEQLEKIFIFHPDPWPKRRHAKHRLIQPDFLKILAGKMKKGGLLTIQTDDAPYAAWIESSLKTIDCWVSSEAPQRSVRTLYEEKMQGKLIFTFTLKKC